MMSCPVRPLRVHGKGELVRGGPTWASKQGYRSCLGAEALTVKVNILKPQAKKSISAKTSGNSHRRTVLGEGRKAVV